MYPVYSSIGIILKSIPQGESGRLFFVYTKEFGLVRIAAEGIRKVNSKLRMQMTDFSLVTLELIRGKEVWRLVAAERRQAFNFNFKTVVSISALILRLCDLEEKSELLFEDLKQGFILLQKKEIDAAALEAVLVLRLLARLGYVGTDTLLSFVNVPLSPLILPAAREKLSFVVTSINETLKRTAL